MKTTKRRCFACYGAIAAVTVAAAAVLTACEPADMSVARTDWGAALDWSQLERPAMPSGAPADAAPPARPAI